MISKKKLIKIHDYLWELPKNYRSDMRVPAFIYASKALLEEILQDRSLEQLVNVTTLPGIRKSAIVMPDAHEGYGFPIGAIAATSYPEGVISPGGIGYDINCGVRLLRSELTFEDLKPYLEKLAKQIFKEIPLGVGQSGVLKLGMEKLDEVLLEGASGIIKKGYGEEADTHYLESYGVLKNADPRVVSEYAKKRGYDQLGTMGAGNHFVEIDRVDKIFEMEVAKDFGLSLGQIVVLIHTGSRGLGHQVATDYIRIMNQAMSKYGVTVADRQLACVPFSSPEGTSYFNAMAASANFAFANRQMITWEVRKVWRGIFGNGEKLSILYDVAHNIAKIEEHVINGKKEKVIVHRKGATRAFPPNHAELIGKYQKTGQPVIIPGSMGTSSYVLAGTIKGMEETFGSSCHGAGRRMSRHKAKKEIQGEKLLAELKKQGIYIETGSVKDLAEESPLAYKNVHDVVDVVDKAGIAKKVARLQPVVVIKG